MSHTFHEDEQRHIHFEEWDRVLDDHLDTIQALNHGVDPHLDWVWDDREYLPPLIRALYKFVQALIERLADAVSAVTPILQKAWDGIATAARDSIQWIADITHTRPANREKSLVSPTRFDARRVTHTRTKPPAPARIYRRRTP